MRASAAIVRGGLGVAIMGLLAVLIVGLVGGQDQPLAPTRPASPSEISRGKELIVSPVPPKAARPSLGGPDGVIARSRDEFPAVTPATLPPGMTSIANRPSSIIPAAPASSGVIVPTSGLAPAAPQAVMAPIAPAVSAPSAGAMAPLAPVINAGPIVPPTPVVNAAGAVPNAPTAPVIPIPTMAVMPAPPVPIDPIPMASSAPQLPLPTFPPGPPVGAGAPLAPSPPAPLAQATLLPLAPAGPLAPSAPVHPPTTLPIDIRLPTKPTTLPSTPLAVPQVAPTPEPLAKLNDLVMQPIESVPLPAGFGDASADGTPLNDYWRYGLRFESADKNFSLFVGGRFQFDVVNYWTTNAMRQNIPGNVPLEDGTSFRRVRLDMGGTLYKNIEFYAQVDFFNGFVTDIAENRLSNVTVPTDMWVQFSDLPWVGNIRVGNQKPLYSFEHLTSSRFLHFLERSLGFDAFAENFNNGFAPGITFRQTFINRLATAGIGVFKNTRSAFGWNVGRNETEVSGRVTGLPVFYEDGKYLVHVGIGAADRDLDDDQARMRSRLDARNSPSAFGPLIADTGLFFGTRQQLLIPELAVVAGPWTFQSEYYASWVQRAYTVGPTGLPAERQGTIYMQSVYGEVLYFLTGEHREYDRNNGVFTRVVPKRPLSWTRCGFTGCGAWQLAARYSYLDLNDKAISGGQIHDMTLGVNWFLNPNMKVQWNYFLAHRNVVNPAGDGFIQGFGTRLAIDF